VDQISNVFLSGEIQETAVTSLLLPAIFLGVTAFLLNVVLARLVATQREQIAVLKAFGYTNASVALHYLLLASGPILIGAIVGIGLGIWLGDAMAGVYSRFFQFPVASYHQDWGVVATAFLVSAGAALVGAFGAVRRVVALPPAEAMRPEAPASFRPGVAERLGLGRLVPPAQRMMLRNIERRPVKAALAVVGIAFATAIVFTGWYMFDVMDVMKVIQFEEIQRSDVMVVFQHPRSASARWALERLDGVRRVEPFRMVPVRLRHAHRTRRAAVLGLEPAGELQRIVDRDRAVRPVPRGGLLLSGFLARRLAVAAGDTLVVEVLEGKRPETRVVVAAVNEDILGTSVVMSRPALEALLGEGGAISGAYLAVDDRQATALYRTLKQTPAVGGVLVREATVRGFEQTIAESFWISISLMVLFACVIAAGVIYNGSRVALSERGRELASLRVLGFHRGEVARLLLGEQALLILAGLPAGFLMGWGLIWLIAVRFESELYRIPMMVRGPSYVYSLAVVAGAAVFSFAMVRRRIWRLDLVAVLKTRE
jgi:putative ABC transport system permease protein